MPPAPSSSWIRYFALGAPRVSLMDGLAGGWQSPPGRVKGAGGILPPVRYLGLDVGDKRIGVALSDETATLASGLRTVERVGPKKDPRAIADLVREHGAGEVVVGL